uniref:Mesoderm-expressed-1 protein n=1 Tax=Tritia obsoleta TaxID=1934733 RepID=A0A8F4TDK0_9CAEN|nr:mesoderm-expressed-1 protein [Tritia obsoleta]
MMAFKLGLGFGPLIVCALVVIMVKSSGAINCYECNAFFQGRRGTACTEPHNRTDCHACMKVITKVQMNDGWLIRRTSEVYTKYCARVANSPGLKEEGCYYQSSNGGYTQRCFCYTDGCNQGTSLLLSSSPLRTGAVLSLAMLASAWLLR